MIIIEDSLFINKMVLLMIPELHTHFNVNKENITFYYDTFSYIYDTVSKNVLFFCKLFLYIIWDYRKDFLQYNRLERDFIFISKNVT